MIVKKYNIELTKNHHPFMVEDESYFMDDKYLNAPEKIVGLLNNWFHLWKRAEEYVYMIAMSSQCEVLGVFELSHGSANASILQPREVFLRALLCGAVCYVIVHNHPSGCPMPSEEDRKRYENLMKISEIMGIPMLDFLIVGDDFYSIKRSG